MQTKMTINMYYASHHRHRGSVDERQVNAYPHRHTRVTSQADSISSDASTSSTLVDTSAVDAAPYYYTDDEQLFAQFADMLPIPEHPEPLYPAAASSIMLPDIPDSSSPTPASSCHYLLAPPSPTHQKPPRLWLHRRRRPTPPPSPTPTPADARASFLAALLHARWPKSEGDDPIFGRTTPRARSPCRAPTAPRSILTRADSRASRRRGPGSVKFAETPRTFEYACEEGWDEDEEDARAATALGTYGERWAEEEEEEEGGDGDSVITYPPPAQAPKRGAGILKRCFGQSQSGEKEREREKGAGERPTISGPFLLARSASVKATMSSEKLAGERPVISGPFPLARAASMRDMKGNVSSEKLAARSQRERSGSLKEREREKAESPVKKGGMLRTFWGRLHVGVS